MSIRFVVNGEPYDVANSLLEQHRDTKFYAAASYAITSLQVDKDGVPLVKLSGDPRAYRILFHYITTGELILPHDALDRQILLKEAGLCNVSHVVGQLMTMKALPLPVKNDDKEQQQQQQQDDKEDGIMQDEPQRKKQKPNASWRPGYVVPDIHEILKETDGLNNKAQEKQENEQWAFTIPASSIDKSEQQANAKMQADEYAARVTFGKDENGTVLVPLVDVFGKNKENTTLPAISGHGGSSYDCLTFLSHEHARPMKSDDHRTPMVYVNDLNEFKQQLDLLTWGLLDPLLKNLPLIAAGGVLTAALHRFPCDAITNDDDKEFIAKGLAESNVASPFPDSVVKGNSLLPMTALHVADVYSKLWSWRSVKKGDVVKNAGTPTAENLSDPYFFGLFLEMNRIRFPILGEPAIDTWENEQYFRRRIDNHAWTKKTVSKLDEKEMKDEKDENEGNETADLDRRRRLILRSFMVTDIDLFLVTRDPNIALKTMQTVDARLRELMPPEIAKQIRILRTAHATTWNLPRPYRHIQVIHRLYYSLQHVLLGFDIDSCCLGYDGNRLLALPRAMRALRDRYNVVDITRQSTTYEQRLAKYAKRGFRIAVPLMDLPAEIKLFQSILNRFQTRKSYHVLTGLQQLLGILYSLHNRHMGLGMLLRVRKNDYGYDHTRQHVEGQIRSAAVAKKPLPFAYGTDFLHVMTHNECSAFGRNARYYRCNSMIDRVISFQANRPHAQDRLDVLFTGSFHPTHLEWYGAKLEVAAKIVDE